MTFCVQYIDVRPITKESVKENNIDQIINQDIVDKISVYNIDISDEFSADEDIKIIIQDINKCISKNKNTKETIGRFGFTQIYLLSQ